MKSSLELLQWSEFGVLLGRFTESDLGRERARRLQPITTAGARRGTAMAVAEAMDWLRQTPGPLLGEFADVRELLAAAHHQSIGLDGEALAFVLAMLSASERVRGRFGPDQPELARRARSLPDFASLVELLARTVDARGRVQDGASNELLELRHRLDREASKVRDLAQQLAGRPEYRGCLREGPPVLRDGRFMLAVRTESRSTVPGVLHDRSSSGHTSFVEPRELVEPQNRLAALQAKERHLVNRVLLERSKDVLAREGEIHEALNQLGSLDLVLARARYGIHCGGRLIPVQAGPLVLRRAYHPLLLELERGEGDGGLERARSAVEPFDLILGDDFDLLVITGPNTGGKTVTLKAIGLLSLLALAAVPVPVAQGSQVPEYDAVHADIGDEQDMQQSLSTFSGHLQRISHILRKATRRSLVLMDELGSGTDPQEGEALSHALLMELQERGCQAVATTHLSGLKELGFEEPRIENASMEFDARSLKPLFRLTLGLPGESNALTIARRHGVPDLVLHGARRRLERGQTDDTRRLAEQVQRSRETVLQKLSSAEEEHDRVRQRRAELEGRIQELEERNRGLEEQKEREIDRVLLDLHRRGQVLLEGLGSVPAALKPRLLPLREFLEDLPRASTLGERRTAYVRQLKKDDQVYLPRYREHCRVRKVDRSRELVTVLYRSMAMEVPFHEVHCPEDFVP